MQVSNRFSAHDQQRHVKCQACKQTLKMQTAQEASGAPILTSIYCCNRKPDAYILDDEHCCNTSNTQSRVTMLPAYPAAEMGAFLMQLHATSDYGNILISP